MDAIRDAGVSLGVDPLGGASAPYWGPIAERYGLDLTVVNDGDRPDLPLRPARPRRQDPHGLLVAVRDGGADRAARPLRRRRRLRPGRRPPRHRHPRLRPDEPEPLPRDGDRLPVRRRARVARGHRRRQDARVQQHDRPRLPATSAAASWRCPSASSGSSTACSTARSASAARRAPAPRSCAATAAPWSTDKDGILLALLAAEITARTGRDPGAAYAELTERFGTPAYKRIDAPADAARKAALAKLSSDDVHGLRAGRRADPADPHRGAGQRRADRRAQGGGGARLVRRAAVGHGGHLQALRGEPARGGAPRAHPRRGAGCRGRSGAARRAHEPRRQRRLHHRPRRRRGQAARPADRGPGEARGAVRRPLPPDRLRALQPGQRELPAASSCSRSTRATASTATSPPPGGCRRCWATT